MARRVPQLAGLFAAGVVGLMALTASGSAQVGEPVELAGLGSLAPIFSDGFELGTVLSWDSGPGPTQSCPFTPDGNGFFTLTSPASSYVVRLPPGYDVENPTPRRLLVAIHGCGDTAYNFATWAAVPWELRATQDYIAISIGGRDGQCWNVPGDAPIVTEAVTHVSSCFYVHKREKVLAGYSSGGGLSYRMAMTDAANWAGALIENSSMTSVFGAGNIDNVLNVAAWKIHIGHSARIGDLSYPIAGVRLDRDKMLAHAFPLDYRELAGDHNGTSADWSEYLIPLMADWITP